MARSEFMGSPFFRDSLFSFSYKIVSFQLNEYDEAQDLILAQDKNYPV
jgi:hypothetical protein